MPPPSSHELDRGHQMLSHLHKIPWFHTLLTTPNTTILHHLPRRSTSSSKTKDIFWSTMLNSPDLIRGVLTLIPSPSTISPSTSQSYPRVPSCTTLFDLGPNLAGHAGMAHGGLISTLLDEATGTLINLLEDLEVDWNDTYAKKTPYTLTAHVTYRKPVPAPGFVIVRSALEKVDGKKRVVRGVMEGEGGEVLCEGVYEFLLVNRERRIACTARL